MSEAIADDAEHLEDRNLTGIQRLRSPAALKGQLPLGEVAARTVSGARAALRACLHGTDDRLVVITGPCSIHDPEAALEYAERLAAAAQPLSDALVVVMRAYVEKPRTTVGWKGLVNDPHLDDSRDVPEGLARARRLLIELSELGVACASELLDPFTPQFVGDLLAWASIGARTAESQTHRELASGLSMPVGFKNNTEGDVGVARNAFISARHPHSFLGITHDGASAVVHTRGNPDCHLVLRGGSGGPNYDAAHVAEAARLVADSGPGGEAGPLPVRPILVDCSHGNSRKDHRLQAEACRDVLAQVRGGQQALLGIMLESHLEEGRQDAAPGQALRRGVSITDACIGWAETADLLGEAAEAARARRSRGLADPAGA